MKRLILLAALVIVGCVHQGPTVPPIPELRRTQLTFHIQDQTTGKGLYGVRVLLDGTNQLTESDENGRVVLFIDRPSSELFSDVRVLVTAPGYHPVAATLQNVPNVPTFDAPNPLRLEPDRVVLPRLRVRGNFFELETGEHWTGIGASDFNLFARFVKGEDIEPVLQQRRGAGFNLLRVWTRMQLAQFGIGDLRLADYPDLYEKVGPFLQAAARHGLYIEFTAYAGREDFDPQHWNKLIAAIGDETNVLVEAINENDQAGNHVDETQFQNPPNLLASHGSNGSQQLPVTPFFDYVTFHTNGAPEEQRKAGHNCWEIWNGPCLTNETSRYPDVGMWAGQSLERQQQLAFDTAAGCALLNAGCVFHSVHGKNSQLWDANELAVANAWANGFQSVPLDCQDGGYRHEQSHIDTEIREGLLRVYQRGYDDRCIVRIRK